MELKFRNLNPEEIECKAVVVRNKIELSLHCKASTCTRILNETVGPMGWEKSYTNGNKNCIVSIWDKDKNRMISKEDCGGALTEIDGYKGQASNGFKRVCALGWGLGIELYTQPHIAFPVNDDNTTYDDKNNHIVAESYFVKAIEYSDENDKKQIVRVVIVDSNNKVVYDGPNEDGESNVEYPVEDDEVVIIPENADMINSEENDEDLDEPVVEKTEREEIPEVEPTVLIGNDIADEDKELPDNTDGYGEEIVSDGPPFVKDYRTEITREMRRTGVSEADVLKVLGISSLNEVNDVDEALVTKVLDRLKKRETTKK